MPVQPYCSSLDSESEPESPENTLLTLDPLPMPRIRALFGRPTPSRSSCLLCNFGIFPGPWQPEWYGNWSSPQAQAWEETESIKIIMMGRALPVAP